MWSSNSSLLWSISIINRVFYSSWLNLLDWIEKSLALLLADLKIIYAENQLTAMNYSMLFLK